MRDRGSVVCLAILEMHVSKKSAGDRKHVKQDFKQHSADTITVLSLFTELYESVFSFAEHKTRYFKECWETKQVTVAIDLHCKHCWVD